MRCNAVEGELTSYLVLLHRFVRQRSLDHVQDLSYRILSVGQNDFLRASLSARLRHHINEAALNSIVLRICMPWMRDVFDSFFQLKNK